MLGRADEPGHPHAVHVDRLKVVVHGLVELHQWIHLVLEFLPPKQIMYVTNFMNYRSDHFWKIKSIMKT